MRNLIFVFVMCALTACNAVRDVTDPAFTGVRGHLGITNGPRHRINVYVNHKPVGSLIAGQSQATFTPEVPIPNRDGVDDYDQTVYPTITIEDLDIPSNNSFDQPCLMGARIITSITYSIEISGSGQNQQINPRIYCSYS